MSGSDNIVVRHRWVWVIPFMYVPSIAGGIVTPFGKLEISDFIVLPFLALLAFCSAQRGRYPALMIAKLGLAFVAWALIGVLLMALWYDYSNRYGVLAFSLLKIGKFTLYGFIGLKIAAFAHDAEVRKKLDFVMLLSAVITAVSLVVLSIVDDIQAALNTEGAPIVRHNQLSGVLAMLICYMLALRLSNGGTARWRRLFLLASPVLLVGLASSGGRAGMMAAVIGFGYYIASRGINAKAFIALLVLFGAPVLLYQYNPAFRTQVEITFNRDPETVKKYHLGSGTIDMGGRFATWLNEGEKFSNAPLFGTGFHHRGGLSGLWPNGSHNFWLQIFLETGVIGGIMILFIFSRMWHDAGAIAVRAARLTVPLRSALVAAFVVGLTGEYFYGGMGLFTLLLLYSFAGSMKRKRTHEPLYAGQSLAAN